MWKSNKCMTLQPLGKVENSHKHRATMGKSWSPQIWKFLSSLPHRLFTWAVSTSQGKNLAPVHPLLTYAIPFRSLFLVEHVTHHTQSINKSNTAKTLHGKFGVTWGADSWNPPRSSHHDDNQLNVRFSCEGREAWWFEEKKKNHEVFLLFLSMGRSRIVSTLESMWLIKFMKPTLVTSRRPTRCVFLWRGGTVAGWRKKEELESVSTFLSTGLNSRQFYVSLLLCILRRFLVDRLGNNVTGPSPRVTLRSATARVPPATTRGRKPTGRFSSHRKGPVIHIFP